MDYVTFEFFVASQREEEIDDRESALEAREKQHLALVEKQKGLHKQKLQKLKAMQDKLKQMHASTQEKLKLEYDKLEQRVKAVEQREQETTDDNTTAMAEDGAQATGSCYCVCGYQIIIPCFIYLP